MLWTEESMVAAVEHVKNGIPLHKSFRLYNVPLRRRVIGRVDISCKPGPGTILTEDEEEQLYKYAIEIADRGFGLSREDLMRIAVTIVAKPGIAAWPGVASYPVPGYEARPGVDGQHHPKIFAYSQSSFIQ